MLLINVQLITDNDGQLKKYIGTSEKLLYKQKCMHYNNLRALKYHNTTYSYIVSKIVSLL